MLPELHAAAWMEMFEPGVKISPEVGLTSETLGASTFEDVDPGTTVHGAAVPVPVEVGEALAVLLEDELAVPVDVAVVELVADALVEALAEVEAEAEAEVEVDGLELGDPPVLLLQVTPFSVKAVGVSIEPERLKSAPMPVEPPVAIAPFQLRLATLTVLPLCDQVPLQPLESVSDPAYEYCRFQLVIAGPSLVIVISTWKPVPQFDATL